MQHHRDADQECVILPSVQVSDLPIESISYVTSCIVREVREQLMYEIAKLTADKQMPKFAPRRNILHGALQASAVCVSDQSLSPG